MKLGIMQPYFYPYIGYWQLMNLVDEYVIADDVQYIKNGFINRNKILINGEGQYFRIPVHKPSQNKLICEHETSFDEAEIEKMLSTLKSAYAKAPNYEKVAAHVREVLEFGLTEDGKKLSLFLENAIKLTARELGITTPIKLKSRDIILDGEYKREHYVVAICKATEATEYYNAIGGTKLYYQSFFRENGLGLKFVHTNDVMYQQFGSQFVPNLSVLDMMMFCSQEQIAEFLNACCLEDGYESEEEMLSKQDPELSVNLVACHQG